MGFVILFVRADGRLDLVRDRNIRKRRLDPLSEEVGHAGDEFDEALGAGIHNARLAQDFELIRRVRERFLDAVLGPGQDGRELAFARCADLVTNAFREGRDHRENRTLSRLGQGVVRVFVTEVDRLAERVGREARDLAGRVAHALEELRDNRPGVAARSVEQGVRDGREHRAEVLFPRLVQNAERRA